MKYSNEKRKMELPEGGEERTQTEGGVKNDNTMCRMQKTHTGENPEAMVLQKMQAEKETHPSKDMEKIGGEDKTQHKGDAGMGIYDNVSSLVCKRGEKTFVGSWMFSEPLDWDFVYEAWDGYVSYCHRHNIVIGRHGERSNE